MYDLKNKLVFITGSGSGIGYETCIAFAKRGCDIIATDIDNGRLTRVVLEAQRLGVKAEGFPLDVSNESEFKALADFIIKEHGCPDIVVNNAGILYMGDVMNHSREMWQRTLDVNVMGVVFGTQAFLESMEQKDQPKFIVNVASQASRTPYVYMSAYAASKYAVEGYTDALRTDLSVKGSNVVPISIHPGVINTNVIPNEGSGFSQQAMNNLQGKYDTKGTHPSAVAEDIVAGVLKNKTQVWTGSMAKLGYWVDKLLPKKVIAKLVAKDAVDHGFTLDV